MISSFIGKYRFLSNFWPTGIWFEDRAFYSVEAAYQSAKKDDPKYKEKLGWTVDPVIAKRIGKNQQGPDWPTKSIGVMLELLRQKFKMSPLREQLLATGEEELIEGNTWGDRFWGQCPVGNGENNLGKLLMKVRSEIKQEKGIIE